MNLFGRKAQIELPPISLADEAISMVGFHDAMRAQSLCDLREWRRKLASNIEAETKALAAVDEQIAREEAVDAMADETPANVTKMRSKRQAAE
jgi:hypothetical protein